MSNRDVGRFDRWSSTYDDNWLQPRFFEPVRDATLDLASRVAPHPGRVLDVGCGTGTLLRKAAERFDGAELVGVDPAPGMVEAAGETWPGDRPARFLLAPAERLPFQDGEFGLVMSTISFHHWRDQQAGLREIGRVLAPGGCFVLSDIFAVSWLRVWFAAFGYRSRFHTRPEISSMLQTSGLIPGGFEPAFAALGQRLVWSVWAKRQRHDEVAQPGTMKEESRGL